MGTKKLILATVSALCLTTSAYGAWNRVKCLGECTKIACADSTKKQDCTANCPPMTLKDSCNLAQGVAIPSQQPEQKPHVQPTLPSTSAETLPSANLNLRQSGVPSASVSDEPAAGTEPLVRKPVRGIPVDRKMPPRALPQPPSPRGQQAEPGPKVVQPSNVTYTNAELNEILKTILVDHFREVTTGCNSAKTQIESGIKMINALKDPDAVDLTKRGLGFLSIIEKETKQAKDNVDSFKILGDNKLPAENIKVTFQKSQEKSLLAAQDCKVKHGQFQGWLTEYWAKHPSAPVKKAGSSGLLGIIRK